MPEEAQAALADWGGRSVPRERFPTVHARWYGAFVTSSRVVVLLSAVLLASCARDAILEVHVALPAGPANRYALVQFETSDADFTTAWARTAEYPGTQLGAAARTVDYSVITESPETRLRMKVSFCTTADCSGIDDAPDRVPAVWYQFDRAFYIGQRTSYTATIATVPLNPPTAPTMVDRCSIAGCVDAVGTTTNFCRIDGRHYCE